MFRLIAVASLLPFALACHKAAPPPTLKPGHYLYVIDGEQGEVSGYRLNEASGALTPLAGFAFLKGHVTAHSLTLSSDGTFGFLGTLSNMVPVAVDATGVLTERTGVELQGLGFGAAIHPSDKYLYYSNALGFDMKALGVDGKLSKAFGANYGVRPDEIEVDPSGRLLTAYNQQSGLTYLFEIDATTGKLTALPGSPVRAEDFRTRQSRLHPDGQLLFILTDGTTGSHMHVFLRSPDGILPVVGSPFPLRNDAQSFAFSPDGRYLYVAHKKTQLLALYAIDDAGGIHPANASPFNTAKDPELVEVDPSGKYLYLTYPGTASVFSVAADTGAVTPIPGSTTRASLHPRLRPFVYPAATTEVASLPAPESANLQPIDGARPLDPDEEQPSRRASLHPPGPITIIQGQRAVACSALGLDGAYSERGAVITNVQSFGILVQISGFGNTMRVKSDHGPTDDVVEVTAALRESDPPRPVPIKAFPAPIVEGNPYYRGVASLGVELQFPLPDDYVDNFVASYVNGLLTRTTPQSPKVRDFALLARGDRTAAVRRLKEIYRESPPGAYEITCTYHPKNAGPDKAVSGNTRIQIV